MAEEKQLVVKLALKAGGYKEEIKNINNDTKLLRSEFEKAGSGSKDFEKTLDGQKAKLKQVSGEYENAQKKVQVYSKQLSECEKTLDSTTKSFQEQQSEVKKIQTELEKARSTYGSSSKEVKELEKSLINAEKALETKRKAVVNADNSLKTMQTTVNKTEAEANKLSAEMKELSISIDRAGSEAGQTGNELNSMSNKMDDAKNKSVEFGAHMTMIGQGLVTVGDTMNRTGDAIVGKVGELVNSGAEYNASIASTAFMMNTLEKAVQDWINTSSKQAESIGVTEKQYKQMATVVAVYAKNQGFAGQSAIDFSSKIMNLSADMAALVDIPVEESLDAIKSALVGNFNAVDKFGMTVNVATINSSAFAKALGKTWEKMSMNEKSQAILSELTRQGAAATGLAKQEAEQFGMKSKLLNVQLEETKGLLGEALLPILEPIVKMLSDVVKQLASWIQANPQIAQTLLIVVAVLGGLLSILGPIITTVGMLVISIGALAPVVTAAGGAAAFFSASILPVITVIGAVIAVIAVLGAAIYANWEGIKTATQALYDKCAPAFEQLKLAFSNLWETAVSIYETIIAPLFMMIGQVIEYCIGFITPIIQRLIPVFTSVFNMISSLWNNVLQPVFQGLMWIIEEIGQAVKPIFDVFGAVICGAMDLVLTPIRGVMDMLSELFGVLGKVGGAVKSFFGKLFGGDSRSIDVNMNATYSEPQAFNLSRSIPVALSGSYYQPQTFASREIVAAPSINSTFDKKALNQISNKGLDLTQISVTIADAIMKGLQGIQLEANVTNLLDSTSIASKTANKVVNVIGANQGARGIARGVVGNV